MDENSRSTLRQDSIALKTAPVLRLRGITKRYGSNVALSAVDFELAPGEIHAVLGENGAGKSTLMHVMRGLTRPDIGQIEIGGKSVVITSPDSARRHGIGMVHQHFMLVPSFTVAENLALGEPKSTWYLKSVRDEVSARAAEIAQHLDWRIPLDTRVGDLPVGTQQRVEIVRALMGNASILLFDEPTAVLAPTETVELFRVLRTLRNEGRSLIFVSHKLSEVMSLCNRVTVLRRGKVVGTLPVSETNPRDLAERMVGSEHKDAVEADPSTVPHSTSPSTASNPIIALHDIATMPQPNAVALHDISFSVMPGQILGFAGVDGNGQSELAEVLTGLRRWTHGTVTFDGRDLAHLNAPDLDALGIAYIPPDRHREGLALDLSIEENLLLQAIDLPEFRVGPFVRRKKLREYAGKLARDFDIRSDDLRLPARSLSGGNQQKIVAARALAGKPKLLIAVSPTRGLDVAATAYIHDRLRERRDEGGAIILISTELDEIIELSNRIAVLSRGEIVDIVPPDTPRTSLGLMMGGGGGNA
jgi:simple sugar transport system ATP-binding protein